MLVIGILGALSMEATSESSGPLASHESPLRWPISHPALGAYTEQVHSEIVHDFRWFWWNLIVYGYDQPVQA